MPDVSQGDSGRFESTGGVEGLERCRGHDVRPTTSDIRGWRSIGRSVELGERALILDGCFVREHAAVTGVEIRVTTIVSASATAGHADVRGKRDVVGMWSTGRRHGFERIRHASMPTACGLMTGGSPRKRSPSSERWKSRPVTDVWPDCESPLRDNAVVSDLFGVLSSDLDLDPALVAVIPRQRLHADGGTGSDAPRRPQHFHQAVGHRSGDYVHVGEGRSACDEVERLD